MPEHTNSMELPLDINTIWDFIQDMNNWAPLVPGYISHEILNERQSTWTFQSDLGFMKKDVTLQIDIKEWNEPNEVIFDLKGLSDNFGGSGYFLAEKLDENRSRITGHLEIKASGIIGEMVNSVLANFVPQTTEDLTEAIANKLLELNKK